MLFERRFWQPIVDGTVTVTFRRWKAPQARAGGTYRTPNGMIDVVAVDVVPVASISAADAAAAGYADVATLVADLRGAADQPVYRVEFRPAAAPDARAELASSAELGADDVADIERRLERLDRASKIGPWTHATLELIEARPQVRAGDLADAVGRERAPFKLDVRKLKNLGLTLSHDVGYELSPRGRAYLTARAARR